MLYNGGKTREVEWVKIYLDSYIATGFWLHLLCLYLCSVVREKRNGKIKVKKIAMAALVCTGVDTVTMFLAVGMTEYSPVFFIFISVTGLFLGGWIAYGRRKLIQNTLLLFSVTALFAGFFQLIPIKNAGLFCFIGILCLPMCISGVNGIFRTKQTQMSIYKAMLYQNEKEASLSAFMDTGNRLRLYGSSIPVVLVDEIYLAEWIKEAERVMPQKLVFLPYKGVGGKGILHGVRLRIALFLENGQMLSGEVAAMATEHRLFHGCVYQMILQPEVLSMVCVTNAQEGEKNVV